MNPSITNRKKRKINVFVVSVVSSLLALLVILATTFVLFETEQEKENSVRQDYSSGPVYIADFDSDPRIYDFKTLSLEIPEIASLGFGSIVLPVIQKSELANASSTLRLPTSWNELDSKYGNSAELKALVDKAHESNLRVLMTLQTSWLATSHPWLTSNPEWFLEAEEEEMVLSRIDEDPEAFSQGQLLGARKFRGELFFDVVKTWKDNYKIDGIFVQNPFSKPISLGSRFSERIRTELSAESDFLTFSSIQGASSSSSKSPLTAVLSKGPERVLMLQNDEFNPDNFAVGMSEYFQASEGPLELNEVGGHLPDVLAFMKSSSTSVGLTAGLAYALPGLPIVESGYLTNPINRTTIEKLNKAFRDIHSTEDRSESPTLEFFVAEEQGTVGFGVLRGTMKYVVFLNLTRGALKNAVFDIPKKFDGIFTSVLTGDDEAIAGNYKTSLSPGEVRLLVSK